MKKITNIQFATAPVQGWKNTSQATKSIIAYSFGEHWVREMAFVNHKKVDERWIPYVSIEIDGETKEFDVKIGKHIRSLKDGTEVFEAEIV